MPGPTFAVVEMRDELDFLMRPVLRGMCKYESLIDGTLDIADIATMNDALAVAAENEYRAHKASMKNG